MAWRDVRAGALSVLDPTGAVFPAHRGSVDDDSDLTDRLTALNTMLGAVADVSPTPPEPERSKARKKLSSLRLVAVMVSFTSATASTGLAAFSLVADTRWPVLVITLLSALALVAIVVFLAAFRLSLTRRVRQDSAFYAALHSLASQRVEDLSTARLVRLSETDPDAARALLVQIVAEYGHASGIRSGEAEADQPPDTARRLMQAAGPSNPVRQTLTMMVSDLQERRA
ncbi:hypothetical protein ACFXG6_32870 [Streptomyces roseus]|uniref:hypothetical protein n=1 Tax=Streptomyces roseus TaxID=66430 RepID=UPI0036D19B96